MDDKIVAGKRAGLGWSLPKLITKRRGRQKFLQPSDSTVTALEVRMGGDGQPAGPTSRDKVAYLAVLTGKKSRKIGLKKTKPTRRFAEGQYQTRRLVV